MGDPHQFCYIVAAYLFFVCQVLEDLRMQLGFEVVPILRNRQSLFFFGESPFDSFGPVPPPTPDYSRDLLGEF